MDIGQLQSIKQWQVGHRRTHPVEYQLWDLMLMAWVAGWIGLLPIVAFDALWAAPACLLGVAAPDLYIRLRTRLHRLHRVRCDWLVALGRSLPGRANVRR